MTYKLRFLPRFQQDLNAAVDYIAGTLQNKTAARAMIDELHTAAVQAAKYPLSTHQFTLVDGMSYRAIRVKNYLAFYVVLDDTVEFRRFLYARADLPTQLAQ